ncbi:MAG: hypothetical protein DRJ42_15530 [Deltaproteobacteria bacterium]|nr:MAG: hypothetical protein DRJ42_15530 [Deltaproteobacteria bacterium]
MRRPTRYRLPRPSPRRCLRPSPRRCLRPSFPRRTCGSRGPSRRPSRRGNRGVRGTPPGTVDRGRR